MARKSNVQGKASAASGRRNARAGVHEVDRTALAGRVAAGSNLIGWLTSLPAPVRSVLTGMVVLAGSGLTGLSLAAAHGSGSMLAPLGAALIVLLGWGAYPFVAGLFCGGLARIAEGAMRRPLMRPALPLQGAALWLVVLGLSRLLRGGHTGGLVGGWIGHVFGLLPLRLGLVLAPALALLLVFAVLGITWGQVVGWIRALGRASADAALKHALGAQVAVAPTTIEENAGVVGPAKPRAARRLKSAPPEPSPADEPVDRPVGQEQNLVAPPRAPAPQRARTQAASSYAPVAHTRAPAAPFDLRDDHDGEWALPSPSLFEPEASAPTLDEEREIEALAERLERTLRALRVDAEVRREDITVGPVVARFGIRPLERKQRDAAGRPELDADGEPMLVRTRVSRILALQSDLALALRVPSLRMEAPVPGQPYVGVEVPNPSARPVGLREVLWSDAARRTPKNRGLTIALGRDAAGHARVGDLTQFPHALIAGATGSGKSVCLHSIICSLLSTHTPEDLRLLLVDPKLVELSIYGAVPHLLMPVITDVDEAEDALDRVIVEMRRRFTLFSRAGVRNLDSYRHLRGRQPELEPLPWIVVVVDEVANLMLGGDRRAEELLTTLAQLARAAGIHLVIATQRPSVDVITGTIKANFPARLAFAMASAVDSRTILDTSGAEHLLGRGDMLFVSGERARPERIQGCRVLDEEIEQMVAHWTAQVQPGQQAARSYVDHEAWRTAADRNVPPARLDGNVTIEAHRAGGRTRWGWEDPLDPPHRQEWR